MNLPTAQQLNDNEESLALRMIRNHGKRIAQLESRAKAKTNFTNAAGAHVIVGTGNPFNIEDPFTGTAILFPPYAHTSGNYHIFGMTAGVLQWGASADDGKIYFGGGDGWLDQYGLFFLNQEGQVSFLDTANGDNINMFSDGSDDLVLKNSVGGALGTGGVRIEIDDVSHNVLNFYFDSEGNITIPGAYQIDGGGTAFPIQNSESILGGTFTITGAANVFQDTGLSVALPSAGTYRITGNVRGNLRGNAGTTWWLTAKLYNSTDAADVANSERIVVLTNVNTVLLQQTCPIDAVVTVAAAKTIKLYAARDGAGGPSWTNSAIESNSAGRTVLSYEKIG